MGRRLSKRLIFRKKIKYGVNNPKNNGLTFNISESGIAIAANKLFIPGTKIIAALFLDEEILKFQGVIIWSDLGLNGYRSLMGIKITSRPEKIKDIYSKLASMNIQ
ncbi:PilZ domain-containing protein [Desulfobacterota bacterium AH_259_B03_O07]|nr:PilZ domain-containing protein [Desulfobacterota bacterium AH_259_B03_O07]